MDPDGDVDENFVVDSRGPVAGVDVADDGDVDMGSGNELQSKAHLVEALEAAMDMGSSVQKMSWIWRSRLCIRRVAVATTGRQWWYQVRSGGRL